MTDELKLCPFCGGDAEQDFQQSYRHMSHGNLDHAAAIYCTRCSVQMTLCRADTRELRDEERMAILVEDWNKRAPVTPPPSPDVAGVVARLEGRAAGFECHAEGDGTYGYDAIDAKLDHEAATLLESLSAEKARMMDALKRAREWGIHSKAYSATEALALGKWVDAGMPSPLPALTCPFAIRDAEPRP